MMTVGRARLRLRTSARMSTVSAAGASTVPATQPPAPSLTRDDVGVADAQHPAQVMVVIVGQHRGSAE